jgi:uncharacterized protein YggE
MRARGYQTAVLLLGLLALGLVACNESTTITAAPEASGIRVSGRGEVTAEPDTGYFTVGVDVFGPTVAEAREGAAKAAEAVIRSLKDNGVATRDIQTTGLSIFAEYVYPRDGGQPTISGYRVITSVEVKVRKLDDFSEIIDDAIRAGGHSARVSGIRFDIDDKDALIEQARELAMKDARAKAEQLARLAGTALGDPVAISESASSAPAPVYREGAAPAAPDADVAIPVEAGTASVTVVVDVHWAFR